MTGSDYASDLEALKRSFHGGGEGALYLRILEKVADRPHLDWLDIGVGRDGRSVRPFAEHCQKRGQSLSITGIDPDADPGEWSEGATRWRLIRTTFQAWKASERFDVINADQSLYYLDLESAPQRMVTLLKPGGLLIATCWSRADALQQLRKHIFTDAALVAEDLLERLRAHPELESFTSEVHRSTVHFDAWRTNPGLLNPAIRVIARSAPLEAIEQRVRALAEILPTLPSVDERINIVLSARRRA